MFNKILIVILLFGCMKLFSQSYKPLGHHFITNYSSKQYRLNTQNGDIQQDNRGIMYFANMGGVLEFDGENWRTIILPTQQTYTLDKSQSGMIYVGALNNFGVLIHNKIGETIYKSLSKVILKSETSTIIREIESTKEWIYFYPDQTSSNNVIYAYNENNAKVVKLNTPGKLLFFGKSGVNVLVQLEGKGLYLLNGVNFEKIGVTEEWNKLHQIESFFEFGNMSFVYDKHNVYTFDKNFSKPILYEKFNFESGSHDFLAYLNNLIYCNENGINVVSKSGQIVFQFSKKFNLIDNNVREIYLDNDHNLWAATENGISVIDISNSLTYFNFHDGIDGVVDFINSYKNNLIAETRSGVFQLKNTMDISDAISFHKYKSITNAPYGVTQHVYGNDTLLFIADYEGILIKKGDDNFERILTCAPWNVQNSTQYNDVLLIPDYNEGLILLVKESNSYHKINVPKLIGKMGRNVFEDDNGVLWLSEETNGLYKIVPKRYGKKDFSFTVDYFDENDGLPNGFSFAFEFNKQTFFGTEAGFYEFNGKSFQKCKLFNLDFFAKKYTIHRANSDPKGNLWVSAYDVNDIKHYFFGYGNISNGKMNWIHQPFFKASEEKIDCIFHENENITWLGGPDGLFRYDKFNNESAKKKFNVILRRFKLGDDSILFGGSGKMNDDEYVFEFAQQHYIFTFASTYYKSFKGVKYSYFLEGFDKSWSKFNTNNEIEFANLYEGEYTLHVKAKDDYGNSSNDFIIKFSILPPWYRTTFAYFGYGILFILIIWGAVRISSNGLKKIIAQRTKEIEEQKHIVEEKNREIIDSISYAKRLQQAILPDHKIIKNYLPQSFILYKPKDIIAGDFYWMDIIDSKIMFAVCDCTGHGVPGAMVSVVGANALNRCVKEFGLKQPSLILDKLTQLVEETFSHSDREVKDGMDVSLCVLDFNSLELEWAGANNPIWLILKDKEKRNFSSVNLTSFLEIDYNKNEYTFAEIKADKQPIGKFDNRKPFYNHKMQLQKGDLIYLFSDGYADQFGGPEFANGGKKFKYSKLKELIIQNFKANHDLQLKHLDTVFENWRGDMEQTDDVCLWGVKL